MVKRPMLQQALQLGRFSFWRLVTASLTALLLLGCGSTLSERTVSSIEVVETSKSEVDLDDVLSGLATAEPRTLFWFDRERDVYDPNLVARDLERIERFYRAQGYYDVKVVAARVETLSPGKVGIEVRVTPGPRVTVRQVQHDAQALLSLPPDVNFKYTHVTAPKIGRAFTEEDLDRYKTELLTTLKESGFAYAKLKVTATIDLNARAADIQVQLTPGVRARFGEIRVVGLRQIPESKVRAALNLRKGRQYSELEQQDAQSALEAMQVFTRVEITPDLSDPTVVDVPIVVAVQEDQLRKLVLGGGSILDALKLEMHVRTGWEHKNFLRGARKLNVEATGGVILFPNRLEGLNRLWVKPSNDFWVVDSSVTLEQPAIFNGRTKGSIKAGYSRRPVLYSLPKDATAANERVIGYNKPNGQIALERGFVGQRIVVRPSYNLEARVPFSYQNGLPDGLDTVWVSYPRLFALFQTFPGDLSKDKNKHDFAMSFRNTVELAGLKVGNRYLFGGSLSDFKIEPEVRGVAPLFPKRHHPEQKAGDLTIAGRLKFGFLVAPDYGSTLRTDQTSTIAGNDDDKKKAANSDQQKLLSRAFYSGGSTSNRGYAQNAISPHGPVGFLVPTTIDCSNPKLQDEPGCIRPLGGFTQWEASIELRYAALYPITIVVFADAADVSRDIGGLTFKYPHLSVGPGVRYESPVGPIRLDLGFRVPGAQAWGSSVLPLTHGPPDDQQPSIAGVPVAIQLAIGDAY